MLMASQAGLQRKGELACPAGLISEITPLTKSGLARQTTPLSDTKRLLSSTVVLAGGV